MPRPRCPRWIGFVPGVTYFKPAGVPLRELQEVVLALDELEALRLADLESRYQEDAAEQMKISRPTFARTVAAARAKVADALINGKALRIEGGPVVSAPAPAPGAWPVGGGRGRGCGRRGWRWGAGPATNDSTGKDTPT